MAHTDPTGFSRLMLNLTEASRTFAPCGSHRFNRLNKKTAGFVSLISHKLAQIFTNYFFVESCWICVSFGNRSTRICPTTFLPNSVRFNIIKSKISEICGICVSQAPAKWWWFWLCRGMFVTLLGVFELYYLTYDGRSGCVGSDLQGHAW